MTKVIAQQTSSHIVHDRESVARYFGVTTDAVNGWARNGMPGTPGRAGGHGWYSLAAIGQWLYRRGQRTGSGGGGPVGAPQGARGQYEHYRALYWGLKCKRELGKVVPKEVLERECMLRSASFCAVIDEAPGVLGPLVAGKSAQDASAIIRDWGDEVKQRLYGRETDLAGSDEREGGANEGLGDLKDMEV